MNYELCYEEGDYVMSQRIGDEYDIKHYYEAEEISYNGEYTLYYDPQSDIYYDADGSIFPAESKYTDHWFKGVRFYFKNGLRCYLPEQDPSLENNKPTKKDHHSISKENIVNFLILDTMAMCQATNWNGANHPTTSWEEQLPCSFAIKSLVQNRCMFWCVNLDGHCDSCEAYDHKTGTKVSFDRIDSIRIIDKERERKNLPSDHHFQDARDTNITYLNNLYNDNKLTLYKSPSDQSIFYDPDWDVFYNHTGRFLEEMTTTRRKQNIHPGGFVKSWSGSLLMETQEHEPLALIGVDCVTKGSNLQTEWFSTIPESDNSEGMYSLEMHELLHLMIVTDGSDEKS